MPFRQGQVVRVVATGEVMQVVWDQIPVAPDNLVWCTGDRFAVTMRGFCEEDLWLVTEQEMKAREVQRRNRARFFALEG